MKFKKPSLTQVAQTAQILVGVATFTATVVNIWDKFKNREDEARVRRINKKKNIIAEFETDHLLHQNVNKIKNDETNIKREHLSEYSINAAKFYTGVDLRFYKNPETKIENRDN